MDASAQEMIEVLNNYDAGWVARRDAAENLGKTAHRIIAELLGHQQDQDMDVQMEAVRTLEPLHVLLATRGKPRRQYTLRDLALACEKAGHRTVDTYKTGFVVTVKLESGRTHRVYIMPHKLRQGRSIIRLFTLCGEATPEKFAWTLKANTKLTHGAFALLKFNDDDHLAIVNNIVKEEATPEMIKRGVKEMAFYGDWLEEKITQMDTF